MDLVMIQFLSPMAISKQWHNYQLKKKMQLVTVVKRLKHLHHGWIYRKRWTFKMPKVLIVSDSHGWTEQLSLLKCRYQGQVDQMIHCGDSELDYHQQEIRGFKQIGRASCREEWIAM